jgi:transposase
MTSAAAGVWEMEQRLEAILAAQRDRRVRGVLSAPVGDQQDRASGADFRQHHRTGPCLAAGANGVAKSARDRLRGDFSCKIHLRTDFDGLPLAFHLTGCEVSDSMQRKTSLDIGPNITLRAALTDKGYDSPKNRAACRERRIAPVIPYRSNSKSRPKFFPKFLYKTRARIEQTMRKLKRSKRVAMRCEKTAEGYAAIVSFACVLISVAHARLHLSCSG